MSHPVIKMVDLHRQYLRIKPEIDEAIQSVLESTAFIQGPEVNQFANELKAYTGAEHVVPCANGTDALQIAMMALGLQPGDEVILPVHTYVATAEVIALLGLVPVFIDVDGDDFTVDIAQLASRLTPKTRAIVPVHLYGQCAHMEPLLKFAQTHHLFVIEDAAQAIGAEYTFSDGSVRQAGTMGEVGTTSFFPSKNLGCFGDGGAMFFKDPALAEKARMIANHGQKVKYKHEIIGVNSRLDTLQAAVLRVKLKYLSSFTEARNQVAGFYDAQLSSVPGIQIPLRRTYSTQVWHQYTLRVFHGRRDELKSFLESRGIPTMIYYPIPLHEQPAYRNAQGSFPVTEQLSREVISLPIHTEMTMTEMEYIVSAIHQFFA